jgi:23S rRNA (uracil1939-C5)-methyltransferase
MSDYDVPEPIDEVVEPEAAPETPWIQGQIIEVLITGLSDSGDGVGRSGNRVVFVPDTVTGDRVEVRLMHVRPAYANAQVVVLLEPSPHRINPSCIVADKCGGCQWQHVSDAYQQVAKRLQVVDALERIGQFVDPPVVESLPIELTLGYRNKVTYPLAMSSSKQVQAGYYRQGSHASSTSTNAPPRICASIPFWRTSNRISRLDAGRSTTKKPTKAGSGTSAYALVAAPGRSSSP